MYLLSLLPVKNENTQNTIEKAQQSSTQSTVNDEDEEDISGEMLAYIDTIVLTDNAGNVAKLLATSNIQSLIDDYQDDALTFELVDKSTFGEVESSVSTEEPVDDYIPIDGEAYIKFYVIESPANDMQVMLFKSGPRYKDKQSNSYPQYTQEWSDLGKRTSIQWVNTPNGQGIEVSVRAKNCGWCGKYSVANKNLHSNDQFVQYHTPNSKRIYVKVKSTDKNCRVAIW